MLLALLLAALAAIAGQPPPGSLGPAPALLPPSGAGLSQAQREKLRGELIDDYDSSGGGFGQADKRIESAPLEAAAALSRAGDHRFDEMVPKTLDAGLQLLDPEWGGIYRCAATLDWRAPRYEKPLASQAEALKSYSLGYELSRSAARYLAAAKGIVHYLGEFLTAPGGAFFAGQEADVSRTLEGARFYRWKAAARRKFGRAPPIDRHLYAEENGLAIVALAVFHDATGDADALARAVRAARWILANRALGNGGFRHGEDAAPPALGDTLEMGEAFLALYRSTGEREWLERAEQAARFLEAQLYSPEGSVSNQPRGAGASANSEAAEPDAELARFANLLSHYRGNPADHALAEKALRLAARALALTRPSPTLLLADLELSSEPLHVTVVGPKSDPSARALFAAALALPSNYARIEWWDPKEGPLPNADVALPRASRSAAYVCTGGSCSLPLHEPDKLAAAALR